MVTSLQPQTQHFLDQLGHNHMSLEKKKLFSKYEILFNFIEENLIFLYKTEIFNVPRLTTSVLYFVDVYVLVDVLIPGPGVRCISVTKGAIRCTKVPLFKNNDFS